MSSVNPVIDSVDPGLKRIFLLTGVREYHPVTDIYVEIRERRRTDETLRCYPPMVTAAGNVSKGGGKFTPRYAVFNDGWRVVPADETHALYVSGEQITDDGQAGPACIDTAPLSSGTNVTIHYEPPAAEVILVLSGSGVTEQDKVDIANTVAAHATVQAIKTKTDGLPSGIPRGQALAGFCFVMLLNGQPVAGLTVTGQRVGVSANVPLTNAIVERRDGVYAVDLTGAELNDPANTFRFTASGTDPQIVTVLTRP